LGHTGELTGTGLRSEPDPTESNALIHMRGEPRSVQHVLCAGLEEALHFGEVNFPAFAERNPWIGQDSQQRRIWILLDPEPASTSESIVRKK
jgi:hypothetical protein